MKCKHCNGSENILTLKSSKKTIHICQSCFDFKNRGVNLIKGHNYKIV